MKIKGTGCFSNFNRLAALVIAKTGREMFLLFAVDLFAQVIHFDEPASLSPLNLELKMNGLDAEAARHRRVESLACKLFRNDAHVLGCERDSRFVAALKQRFALRIGVIRSDDASGRFDFIFDERSLIG